MFSWKGVYPDQSFEQFETALSSIRKWIFEAIGFFTNRVIYFWNKLPNQIKSGLA